ncbi:MAG: hypothetical protein LBB81_07245 [Treponema sp.]|jgi:hypothetical protein|nr:hypothetical protein [Treponema sp.]
MTEKEYDALDGRLTKTVPAPGHTGTYFFSRNSSQTVYPGENTDKILNGKAIAFRQTPAQVIAAMLRKELTAVRAN